MVAMGAYWAFAFHSWLSVPLIPAVAMSLIATTGIGLLLHFSIFNWLRKSKGTPLVLMLASIGVYVIGQNVLSMVFSDSVRSIRSRTVLLGISVWGGRITAVQIGILASAVFVLLCLSLWLFLTRIGREIRAVSSNWELATIVGISPSRIMATVVAVGSAIGGLAGILAALDRDLVPTMGMSALLTGVVVMIVGGQESFAGIALASLLVGVAQNLMVLWIGTAWQDAVVFLVLIVFLILRPQGFFGRPMRKVSV